MQTEDKNWFPPIQKQKEKSLGESIVDFLMAIGIWILGVLLFALMLTLLWQWFVADWFHIKSIIYPEALGLSLLKTAFTTETPEKKDKKVEYEVSPLAFGISFPLLMIIVGYFIHLFLVPYLH